MTDSLGRLLVVDDEEMNRDMLSRRLEIEGYETVCADGGRAALELLAANDFDAVLLDAMMPGMSGYEVLAEIRKAHSILELPVLMVTAKSQSEDMVQAFGAGATDYITKPINFPVALARIHAHVSSRRMAADITRGKAADPLTGFPNRVMLMEQLSATVKAAQCQSNSTFAVLFLDLDRFKVINDSLGHFAGDELLVTVAKRLESCLRRSDIVSRLSDRCTISRFGGDEFVVLLRGLTSPDNATLVADRILETLAEPLLLRGHEVNLTASIGIAVATSGQDSADDLLRDADTAMYQAKSQGKSRWSLFDQSMRKQALDRLALEADLLRGIERGEFQLHYQPIVEMPSKQIKGFEALLRWKHATRGNVPPIEFIPIAEEIGFIVELGAWVLKEACTQVRQWQLQHPEHSQLFISVNVSPHQFASAGLIDHVKECLRTTGLDGRCLKVEITESALMTDTELATSRLEELRALGVTISLDDFGTGYSSLSYLQSLKIDNLKIDRSFIAQLGASDESTEIVRTIINLAHNLGMQVTAEGIEGQLQHAQLQEMTCESGQGYHYSRPLAHVDAAALLRAGSAEVSAASQLEKIAAVTPTSAESVSLSP